MMNNQQNQSRQIHDTQDLEFRNALSSKPQRSWTGPHRRHLHLREWPHEGLGQACFQHGRRDGPGTLLR